MKMLVIADVHGKFEALQKIMDVAEKEDFNLIVCPGDFTDMFDIPPNFTQLDIADIVIQKLLIPNKPLLCVPGNHDPYEILDVLDEYGINLHHKIRKAAGLTLAGWGGAPTPFNTLFEPPEGETKEALDRMMKKIEGRWVLVVHSPPKDTSLDMVGKKKHVGSGAIREAILKKKPVLAISAHIHENSGTDTIGETTVFYPGPAYNGFYGIVEIGKDRTECHIKRVPL
jgi:Icc-related predicted phosphoesterase